MNTLTLNIQNFQRIKDQKLIFKGLSLVKGETSLGKSSIRRVIESLLLGSWNKSYIQEGEKKTNLSLKMILANRPLKINLTKTKTTGCFQVDDKDLPKGGSYPQEIKDLPFESNLNVATIYESLFLLGETPSNVTEKLNNITGVSVFEKVNMILKTRQIKTRTLLEANNKLIEEELAHLDKLLYVEERSSSYEQLEGNISTLEKYQSSISIIHTSEATLNRLEILQNEIETLQTLQSYSKEVTLVEGGSILQERVTTLQKEINSYELLQSYIYSSKLNSKAETLQESVTTLQKEIGTYEVLTNYLDKSEDFTNLEEELSNSSKELKLIEQKLKDHTCSKCNQLIRGQA